MDFRTNLQSSFFVSIEKTQTAIPDLSDNTLYIICRNEEWMKAIKDVMESFNNSRYRDCWHFKIAVKPFMLDIHTLPGNVAKRAQEGSNVIMPLYTPDRKEKLYLIGNVDEISNLESAAAIMIGDAQDIQDRCSMYAFAQKFNDSPEEAYLEWSRLLDYKYTKPLNNASSAISFRGKYSSRQSKFPFLQHEYEIPKNRQEDYEEQLSKIMRISDTIKVIGKPSNTKELETAEKDFQIVCEQLKESEKNQLLLELSRAIPESQLGDIWQSVTNRKFKGQRSSIKIEVRSKVGMCDNGHTDRFEGDIRTYMIDAKGKYHLLNFANNTAHTIYVMNLLFYKQSGGQLKVLDVRKNGEAFRKIYQLIYLDKQEAKEAFDKLMCYTSNTEIDYEGRAKSRCFNSIVNCVTDKCRQLEVDPSPYITDAERPFTFDHKLVKFALKLQEDLESIVFNT